MIVDFWAFEISKSGEKEISLRISFLMDYVNAFANIIYALAFLMIPAPQKFSLK